MPLSRLRLYLFTIFLSGLLIQVAAAISVGSKMWPDELEALLLKLLAIYSVHLTVIIGAMLATPKGRTRKLPAGMVSTAFALTLFWNGLLLWRSLSFAFAERDSVNDFVRYLDRVSSASSFLVTGLLAFLFTRAVNETNESRVVGKTAGRH